MTEATKMILNGLQNPTWVVPIDSSDFRKKSERMFDKGRHISLEHLINEMTRALSNAYSRGFNAGVKHELKNRRHHD
jgi:hypothetical protein